jgi:hypothetical protein
MKKSKIIFYLSNNPTFASKIKGSQDIILKEFLKKWLKQLFHQNEKKNKVAKKSVITFCYLLVGLCNKFTNPFKHDLDLYPICPISNINDNNCTRLHQIISWRSDGLGGRLYHNYLDDNDDF